MHLNSFSLVSSLVAINGQHRQVQLPMTIKRLSTTPSTSKLSSLIWFQNLGWAWASAAAARYRPSLGEGTSLNHDCWLFCLQSPRKPLLLLPWPREMLVTGLAAIMGWKQWLISSAVVTVPIPLPKTSRGLTQELRSHLLPLCSFSFLFPSLFQLFILGSFFWGEGRGK